MENHISKNAPKGISDDIIRHIYEAMYKQQGKTLEECGAEIGLTKQGIKYRFKALGLETRQVHWDFLAGRKSCPPGGAPNSNVAQFADFVSERKSL